MKAVKIFTYVVVALSMLCIYSFFVYDATSGGNILGRFSRSLLQFAKFPETIENVMKSPEVNNSPEAYLPKDATFQTINQLKDDVFGLTSFWNNQMKQWEVHLINLKDDKTIYSWQYRKSDYQDEHYQFANARLMHSAIIGDKNLIIKAEQTPNLLRLDAQSNVVWRNRSLKFHHSINFDADSNIYVCASDIVPVNSDCHPGGLVKNIDGRLIAYREDYITKVDGNSGEILWKKGIGEILIENGLKGLLYGFELWDPIHLNDIQPALTTTKFWEKDDLFLSVRDRSMVILYRPSNNKVIKILNGPFISQHDVDIISDHEISILNNNYIFAQGFGCITPHGSIDSINHSEILIYNFEDESYRSVISEVFEQEQIKSYLEGQTEMLTSGKIFMEENNTGRYFIVDSMDVVLRKVMPTADFNSIHLPNWMRIYEKQPI
ncbi:MAG: hypothetical protein KDD32_12620 [Bacteroidetes bacterium]|nr:hypothetical protein [Bacteroidota bacterium]